MKLFIWSMSLAFCLPALSAVAAQPKISGNATTKLTSNAAAAFATGEISPGEIDLAATAWTKGQGKTAPVVATLPVKSNPTSASLASAWKSANSQVRSAPKEAVRPTALAQSVSPTCTQILAQNVVAGASCGAPITEGDGPTAAEINDRLDGLRNQQFPVTIPGSGGLNLSPAISINNPVGFGADRGTGFISGSFQSRTRGTQKSDGELGIGVGLFDATEAVGLELSYTINSFGTTQGFGSGGFNAKLHKRFGDAGVAVGWNRFANIQFGSNPTDYPQNSYYAVATQVIRTNDDIDSFLSRIALSAGVGGGQFLSADTLSKVPVGQAPSGVNVFGSAAFRVAKPVSAIVEWTGQDLAAGLSITPFDNFPLVITPAFRDISGIKNESARFVLGVGTAWKF